VLKSHLPLLGVALLGVASLARADMIYTLNLGGSCCGAGPFGSITLHSVDADTVMVTETLIPGNVFAVSGAGASLEFTVNEAFTYVPGSLTTGFTSGSGGSASPFGSFGSFVDCTSTSVCGNGTSPPQFGGPLSFEITNAGGLSASNFVANAGGDFFASDIGVPKTGGGFTTGNVASNSGVSQSPPPPGAPEPSTMILLAVGSVGMFFVKKRFAAVKR
jgi:hypothetical protein